METPKYVEVLELRQVCIRRIAIEVAQGSCIVGPPSSQAGPTLHAQLDHQSQVLH